MSKTGFELILIFLQLLFYYQAVDTKDISFFNDNSVNRLKKNLPELTSNEFETTYSLRKGDKDNTICWIKRIALHFFTNGTVYGFIDYSITFDSQPKFDESSIEQYEIFDVDDTKLLLDFVTVEKNDLETVKENKTATCKSGKATLKVYEQVGEEEKLEIIVDSDEMVVNVTVTDDEEGVTPVKEEDLSVRTRMSGEEEETTEPEETTESEASSSEAVTSEGSTDTSQLDQTNYLSTQDLSSSTVGQDADTETQTESQFKTRISSEEDSEDFSSENISTEAGDNGVRTTLSNNPVSARIGPQDDSCKDNASVGTRVLPSNAVVGTRVLPSNAVVGTRVLPNNAAVGTRVLPDKMMYPPPNFFYSFYPHPLYHIPPSAFSQQ